MTSIPRLPSCSLACLLMAGFSSISSAAPPVTPDNLRYEIYSATAAELFWDRTTNVPVRGYEISRNAEVLGEFDSLSFFDDSLVRGVDYTYAITAVGADGERSGRSTVTLRPPRSQDTLASLQRTIRTLEQRIEDLESSSSGDVRAPVPRTGQTVSIRPGDDGDRQAGVPVPDPRFIVNVDAANDLNENGVCDDGETCDGTATDELTGLTWLLDANCFGERGWFQAMDDVNALAADGLSNCGLSDGSQAGDWRLPNVKEILSLIDYGNDFPEPLLSAGHPFVDVQTAGITSRPASYWTSTSTGSGADGVYSVSMSVGWVERLSVSPNDSNFELFVWPVRGGI